MKSCIRIFTVSAGALLLGAALVRFLILIGNVPQLHRAEPLLGLPLPLGILLVGCFELVVALVCLFGSRPGLQAGLLAWASLNYLVFRIGLVWMGIHPEWTCLGSLTDPLHLARGTTGFALGYIIPGALLVGSLAALLWQWRHPSDHHQPSTLNPQHFAKMSCPSCGRHIRFAIQNQGQKIPCPQCQTTITLRGPAPSNNPAIQQSTNPFLKSECYFCKGHVEFPAHALGEKILCPHCQRHITLKDTILKQPA
jgi:predicted RNA-binding Zn-ribbon protein involved in translation (DUF1610 family)